MKKATSLQTVDKYLAKLPDDERNALQKVRETILKAAPMAEEKISYQIPSYSYMGPLIHFASMRKHLSLFGVEKDLFKKLAKELKGFDISGRTMHFSPDHMIPAPLITKMVKIRIASNLALAQKKLSALKKSQPKLCSRGHTLTGSGPCKKCWPGFLKLLK